MSCAVKLIGLDFGTTTSSAVVASAQLTRSAVNDLTQLDQISECYRSDLVFTPMRADLLDMEQIEERLDCWLAAGGVRPEEVFGGGALLTGLTAQKDNASALVHLVRQRLGNALVATADDPCLEAWLAFMGSCAAWSRSRPDTSILNLDIGGGTTNLALGRGGEVLCTGSLFVGARHIRVVPGSYQIIGLSRYALALLGHLGIHKGPGDRLDAEETDAIVDFYVKLLEAVSSGTGTFPQNPVAALHQQIAFRLPAPTAGLLVTFTGGVGELIYGHLQGKPWPPTTCFGDLGIDLARAIVRSSLLCSQEQAFRPAAAGRATVYGLLRHATEVSGSTVYLPQPEILPLPDLPILGKLSAGSTDEQIGLVVDLVKRSSGGGCVQVTLGSSETATVRALAARIAHALQVQSFPVERPLVLFVRENLGKVLGHYITEWGSAPWRLAVIDEIIVPHAQYAHVGRIHDQVLPVSFYGFND